MRQYAVLTIAMTLFSVTAAWAVWEAPPSSISGSNLGAVTGGDFKKAHEVIDKKCVTCHSAERIDAALASGKDMTKIQQSMEKKGVKLDSNEHEVLGIFWTQSPLKVAPLKAPPLKGFK
jgi:uncharacterized membrane protein